MSLDGLDPISVSKLISPQLEQVTCLECCKYYLAPETALCGHTLCHGCWIGRRSCPTCAAVLNRKKLKPNLPLQRLTEHVRVLSAAFEKLFNITIDEFELDISQKMPPSDPDKHVKEWLASSQNHFSAPVHSSQQSTQDHVPTIQLSSSKIQIHTQTKKTQSPVKVVHAPLQQQDWDKIEMLPDTEELNTKNKENLVKPIEKEPFFIDDNEYNIDNPRRSSRKHEQKVYKNTQKRDVSADKYSCRNSSTDTDKYLLKAKQNWNNVKKMRKEFSKLNKKNKSKLNVSIEMCKKAQSKSKLRVKTPDTTEQPLLNINDDTPNEINKNSLQNVNSNIIDTNSITDLRKELVSTIKTITNGSQDKLTQNINKEANVDHNSEKYDSEVVEINNLPKINTCMNNYNQSSELNSKKCYNTPFIKKSALRHTATVENTVEITQNEIKPNTDIINTDDIELSIKVGNTITNIVIKKKLADVQLKVHTDREIQTALGPYGLVTKTDAACSPIRPTSDHNIELNIADGNKIKMNKSISAKKNTASADTATAQFEITDSVEKELSNVMECIVSSGKKSQKQLKPLSINNQNNVESQKCNDGDAKPVNKENMIPNDIADLDELDIFNSGSVKETEVQLLINAKPAPSEILPSLKNKKSQNHPDKRDRDENDDIVDTPLSKKQKIDTNKPITKRPDNPDKSLDIEGNIHDSEPMNYDAIMGQVFASIDADIRTSQKNNASKDVLTNRPINENNSKAGAQLSQIIKTPTTSVNKNGSTEAVGNNTSKDIINQKCSENMFSLLDKESEPADGIANNNRLAAIVEQDSTQQRIDKLLTPGMCRDLISTQKNKSQDELDKSQDIEMMELELGTPSVLHDDDVVEETPQKNMSFSKPKQKSGDANQTVTNETSDSVNINSIIEIDTTSEEPSKQKEITVIGNLKMKSLETPLTINKFMNSIQHNSTPVARKSLNFESENIVEDPEQTICPTTTQEKEIIANAFEKSSTPVKKPVGVVIAEQNKKMCLAGSCLTPHELAALKVLCRKRGWTFLNKYSDELTHLVVGVDEGNKSQRSVKYMCALAASKFIVSYDWVDKCLQMGTHVDECPYEALDAGGEPGPRRSRIATKKLFEGFTFYCMSPFTILEIETLQQMLKAAGGRVTENIAGVSVKPEDNGMPKLLLAEPENTQEHRFVYLAVELRIVPVNYEWVLNCLGGYNLCSINDLLLCPVTLLPKETSMWPATLLCNEDDY